jgi:hypothetical protein
MVLMIKPRRMMIEQLVQAALAGMTPVSVHASGNEVLMASCTLCLRCVQTAIEGGADVAKMREAVGAILLACVDPTKERVQ